MISDPRILEPEENPGIGISRPETQLSGCRRHDLAAADYVLFVWTNSRGFFRNRKIPAVVKSDLLGEIRIPVFSKLHRATL